MIPIGVTKNNPESVGMATGVGTAMSALTNKGMIDRIKKLSESREAKKARTKAAGTGGR